MKSTLLSLEMNESMSCKAHNRYFSIWRIFDNEIEDNLSSCECLEYTGLSCCWNGPDVSKEKEKWKIRKSLMGDQLYSLIYKSTRLSDFHLLYAVAQIQSPKWEQKKCEGKEEKQRIKQSCLNISFCITSIIASLIPFNFSFLPFAFLPLLSFNQPPFPLYSLNWSSNTWWQ